MITTVEFYGKLAEKYGDSHEVYGLTLRSCIIGLCALYPKLRNDIIAGKNWQLFLDEEPVLESDLDQVLEAGVVVQLVPVISGGEPFTIALYVIAALMLVMAIYMYSQMPDGATSTEKSYMFNGALNSNEQGGPVPLIYGQARVGSIVISSAITSEEMEDSKYNSAIDGPGSASRGNTRQNDVKIQIR